MNKTTLLTESSTNFDIEGFEEFLPKLRSLIDSGFDESSVHYVLDETKSMQVEEEKSFEFKIVFEGRVSVLKITVFMDDINAPDVYFFSNQELSKQIDQLIDEL